MNIKFYCFIAVIVLISSCSKESKHEADFRENNPAYAKLTVEGNFIDVFSDEHKHQSLILDRPYFFEKSKNTLIEFSAFKSEGVRCENIPTNEIKFSLDGFSYSFRAKDKLSLKLVDNKYVLDRIIKCDK